MLVLSRKLGESLVIGNGIRVVVLGTVGGRVKLGIVAPADVPVHRDEIQQRIEDGSPSRRFAGCA